MPEFGRNSGSEDVDALDASIIDRVPWNRDTDPKIRHFSEEFVTGCPFENDSDFPGLGVDIGELEIIYVPDRYLLETNTYKEYLNQYQDARLGHEAIADEIFTTTADLLFPDMNHHGVNRNLFLELTYPQTTSNMRRDVTLGNDHLQWNYE